MIVDPAIVGAGHGAQFQAASGTAIFGLERLDLLGAVRSQSILQVDRSKWRRKLTQIGRGCPDLAGQLAEAPMGRRNRRVGAGQNQRKTLGIAAVRLDMDQGAFDDAGAATLGAAAHGPRQIAKREKPFVVGPREPLG